MMKSVILGSLLVLAFGTGVTLSQEQTISFEAFGHQFETTPFQPAEMQYATATDKKTHQKFLVVKTKSGKMMALVSPEYAAMTMMVQNHDFDVLMQSMN